MRVFSILAFTMCVTLAVAAEGVAITLDLPPPTVRAFNDNQDWMLVDDFTYKIGNTAYEVVVPAGFVTDFASVPVGFGRFFKMTPHDKYSRAAIVHDFLYWTQPCSQYQSDNLLMIAMTESGVEASLRDKVYNGVRTPVGEAAWKRNDTERKKGLPRIIPPDRRSIPTGVSWKQYRETLVKDKINDLSYKVDPAFCELGNTTKVPPNKPEYAK